MNVNEVCKGDLIRSLVLRREEESIIVIKKKLKFISVLSFEFLESFVKILFNYSLYVFYIL